MFLPSHLHTCSGSDQKVPAPTGSSSSTLSNMVMIGAVKTRNMVGDESPQKHVHIVQPFGLLQQ